MEKPKFVYQGIKYGLDADGRADHTDGYSYHYGIDVDGKFWISRIEYRNGKEDHESPPKWVPNGTDGQVQEFSKEEIGAEFDEYEFLSHRTHNSASEYVTRHTGGSIRHAGIRVMDVMEMIHDYSKDARRAIVDAYALGVLHEARKDKKVSKLPRTTKRRKAIQKTR